MFFNNLLVALIWITLTGVGWAAERTLVLEFIDIPCPGHVATILEAARLIPGVNAADVDYDASRGSFIFDEEKTSPEEILAAMPHDCPAQILPGGNPPSQPNNGDNRNDP